MRRTATLTALTIISLLLWGCPSKYKGGGPFDPVRINPFSEGAVFTVIEGPELIREINMGRVIVRRETDHSVYAAFVVPPRDIPKGSKVKLSYVECNRDNMGAISDFLIINP
jgi:hypothetical protein